MAQQAADAGAGVLAGQIDPADDGAGQSVVLEEQIDPDYEPSEAEVREYAAWLGMDPGGRTGAPIHREGGPEGTTAGKLEALPITRW